MKYELQVKGSWSMQLARLMSWKEVRGIIKYRDNRDYGTSHGLKVRVEGRIRRSEVVSRGCLRVVECRGTLARSTGRGVI